MVNKTPFLTNINRAQIFLGILSAEGDKYYKHKLLVRSIISVYYVLGLVLFTVSIYMDPKATMYDYVEATFPLMCASIITFNFAVTIVTKDKVKKLFDRLANFEEFGPPTHIENVRKHLEAFTGLLFMYVTLAAWLIPIQMLADMRSCRQLNYLQGRDVICGFATSMDYMLYNIKTGYLWYIHVIVQCYCLWTLCLGGIMVGCTLFSGAELIIARIQHLEELVQEAINADYDDELRRMKLTKCIRYHQDIIDIVNEMNQAFFIIATPMKINYGVVIGLQVLSLLMKITLRTGSNCLGWVTAVFMICLSADRLMGKSYDLATSIYVTEWYNLNVSMRKDIVLMILRAQKPLTINTGALGPISMKLFVAIMKAAYTYGTMKSGF